MAYYGGGPAHSAFPGSQGSEPTAQAYGHQGLPGRTSSGMYSQAQGGPSQGNFNGNNMYSSYGQQQEYFEPQQSGGMMDPRSMMQPTNPTQQGRGETTKILRNPYPIVSDEIKQKNCEIYDPGFPTGPPTSDPSGGYGQYHQQRMAPPPPIISGMSAGALSDPTIGPTGGIPPPAMSYDNGMPAGGSSGMGMYANVPYENNVGYPQPRQPLGPPAANYQQQQPLGPPAANYQQQQPLGPLTSNYHQQQPLGPPTENYQQHQPFAASQYENSSKLVQQLHEPTQSKMQVMTGVVTQIQPGSFGMVSEEIFFQEHVVSGPLPRVGDKVVVEAEPVNGMPFKYNAKRVTRLDVDLVNEEKNAPPTASHHPQSHLPQNYQNSQPPERFQNPGREYTPSGALVNELSSRWEPPNFGPLPSLPDSLNLPRPVPPPNLASVIPSSDSHPPLKSILKRKGSPSLKRNPPPPPVISKNAGKDVVDQYKASAPSSLKQKMFSVDLERDVPRVLPPHGTGPPIEFPEYTFFNKERPRAADVQVPNSPRITRLLPRSPIPEFGGGRSSPLDTFRSQRRGKSRSRSRERVRISPTRYRSRSNSPRRQSVSRRSRSISPRRSRRTRSRTPSPTRHRRYSRSPSPRSRRRSRSASPRNRRRNSRSASRDKDRRSDSRDRRNYRSRRSRSRSQSTSPYRARYSSGGRRSRSNSPRSSGGVKVLAETITHGIVVKHVSSDLFPKLKGKGSSEIKEVDVIRRDGKGNSVKPAPAPIKFQIANKPAPVPPSSIVPNPTYKAANMAPPTFLQNPVYNITKTVANPVADTKEKKKKPKEQEPAFKVVDKDKQQPNDAVQRTPSNEKIKQWESERLALKSKTVENVNNLLKNPVNILQLKQTIQNDLQQLRSKCQSDAGNKLLENPTDIEKLKQTVQKDLEALKTKGSSLSTSAGTKEKTTGGAKSQVPVINKNFDESVEQRLKDLRSKFETHIKEAKASAVVAPQKKEPTVSKPLSVASKFPVEKQINVSLATGNLMDKNKAPIPRFPRKQTSEASSDRSRGPTKRHGSPLPVELPPYDEQMEQLQEEIHQQRFTEEEQRLKSIGDQAGLHQLYYMEDRRRRRMDERQLARIRVKEIQLKQDKMFGELARLREEWGPPAQRLEQERELRQIRMKEEQHENQLHGQAEAIRRQEFEYQRWLEEEAAARSRKMQNNSRASRGCEGRVLRRRTPSPSTHRNQPPPSHPGPPPPDPRGPHPNRRRSRSPSFERYKQDWFNRHPRDRSPPMNYEQFTMRYPIGPPDNFMPPDTFGPPHLDFDGPMEQDGFFISRAMDDVARRQDELMHREMEIQQRIEMAQRRIGGGPSAPPPRGGPPSYRSGRDGEREEIRRYAVPRR